MLYIDKQKQEAKQERNTNIILCFLFIAITIIAPFIENLFNF